MNARRSGSQRTRPHAVRRGGASSLSSDAIAIAGIGGTLVSHLGVAVEVALVTGVTQRFRVRRNSGFVVGDEVIARGEELELSPRRTSLVRRSPGGGVHTVASNLDVVCVVAAIDPPARAGLLDRAAVAARACGIEPVLVCNKVDVDDTHGVVASLRARALDELPFFLVSALAGTGMQELATFLIGKRTALVGPSGVGKSSIANALVPGLLLHTQALSLARGAGIHTTTVSTLTKLPGGGELVDTPGIREFGLVDVLPSDLALYFPGFARVVGACRFRDCLHEQEPSCAIKAAVDSGSVDASRYAAYRTLLAELADVDARGA